MLITIENKYGKSLKEIANSKREFVSRYTKFNKEIFGTELNQEDILETTSCGVSNMENHFLAILNGSLKDEGSEIKLSSLHTELKDQISNHFSLKAKESIMSTFEDSIEFLCSTAGVSEEEMKEKIQREFLSEALEKGFKAQDIESCKIEYLLATEKEFNKEIEKGATELLDIIEAEKQKVSSKNNSNKQKQNKKEEKVSSSDNFVKQDSEDVIDVEFVDTAPMNESDIKELKNKIEECVNYYYNADRIAMMIGGNMNLVTEVMNNVMITVNKMDDIVNNATDKDDKVEISNRLSELQLEISNMISSYNPNVSIGNIINSFKAVEVGINGQPIRVEDFFGKQYDAEEMMGDSKSIEQQNYKIFSKYPDLYNIILAIQQQTGAFIKLEEVKSSYKYMNPILKASVIMNNSEINRYFYIDLLGTLYNDKAKFIILNKSEIIDEGYYISASRIDLITKYIFGTLSDEELQSNDLIPSDIRGLNKLIDLSSINKENKQFVLDVMIQNPSKELLMKSIKFDKECRFRLDKLNGNSFTLISDSKTKKYFNGPSCKRKKQTMTFNNGELILDGKQD